MSAVVNEVSPAELVADVLNRLAMPGIAPGGIRTGPLNDAQQQAGAVSLMAAGLPIVEHYVPVQWMRAQMRCVAPTLDLAERMAQAIQRDLHGRVRTVARMASTDERYLLHLVNVTAGPSMHFDSPETWETLLFAEVMIDVRPIEAA